MHCDRLHGQNSKFRKSKKADSRRFEYDAASRPISMTFDVGL